MDKLKLAGQNLGQVFNFRYGRAFAPSTSFIAAKQPNLKKKTCIGDDISKKAQT
jgi:hypothetical protein